MLELLHLPEIYKINYLSLRYGFAIILRLEQSLEMREYPQ